jgi:hypothetical protein
MNVGVGDESSVCDVDGLESPVAWFEKDERTEDVVLISSVGHDGGSGWGDSDILAPPEGSSV